MWTILCTSRSRVFLQIMHVDKINTFICFSPWASASASASVWLLDSGGWVRDTVPWLRRCLVPPQRLTHVQDERQQHICRHSFSHPLPLPWLRVVLERIPAVNGGTSGFSCRLLVTGHLLTNLSKTNLSHDQKRKEKKKKQLMMSWLDLTKMTCCVFVSPSLKRDLIVGTSVSVSDWNSIKYLIAQKCTSVRKKKEGKRWESCRCCQTYHKWLMHVELKRKLRAC